jgi:methionyl-tRNA formyltransferase
MTINILTDNKNSWFLPYGHLLTEKLNAMGHDTIYVSEAGSLREGDICFLLSCLKILKKKTLILNKHNIVVHGSDLPRGKGFSPVQWQILEGRNEIPITLFEAVEELDDGPWYLKDTLILKGPELYDEIHHLLGMKIVDMCISYVQNHETLKPVKQTGDSSFYPRRTEKDDMIDPQKSVVELFNHFRIASNDQFPLYFIHLGRKFYIKLYPAEGTEIKRPHPGPTLEGEGDPVTTK